MSESGKTRHVVKVCKNPDCGRLYGCKTLYDGEKVAELFCDRCHLTPQHPNCSLHKRPWKLIDVCPECRKNQMGDLAKRHHTLTRKQRKEQITMSTYFKYLFFGALVSIPLAIALSFRDFGGRDG